MGSNEALSVKQRTGPPFPLRQPRHVRVRDGRGRADCPNCTPPPKTLQWVVLRKANGDPRWPGARDATRRTRPSPAPRHPHPWVAAARAETTRPTAPYGRKDSTRRVGGLAAWRGTRVEGTSGTTHSPDRCARHRGGGISHPSPSTVAARSGKDDLSADFARRVARRVDVHVHRASPRFWLSGRASRPLNSWICSATDARPDPPGVARRSTECSHEPSASTRPGSSGWIAVIS